MSDSYLLPAFNFSVDFLEVNGPGSAPIDCRFKEIQDFGITSEIEERTESGKSHGYGIPTIRKYGDVTLKRGFTASSDLLEWFTESEYDKPVKPIPVLISLLNEKQKPVLSWLLYECYLKSWTYGGFNAMESQFFMETIVLTYSNYKELMNDNMAMDLNSVIDIAKKMKQ